MAQPKEYVGTGEELSEVLKQMPKQPFRLTLLSEEEASTKLSEQKPAPTPNQKALAALRQIAENQKDRPYSDGSDTQQLIREARDGAMYGYDPNE